MIHENIYSKRMSGLTKCDPYIYKIEGNGMVNSFMMLFAKLDDDDVLEAVRDFAETKRDYVSDDLKSHILYEDVYDKQQCMDDIEKILLEYSINDVLDLIEIMIINLNNQIYNFRSDPFKAQEISMEEINKYKKSLIDVINQTFQHNNLGYQIQNDVIVTKKSDFLHQEVVVKPLTLLSNEGFSGALEEFKNAIQSYTNNDYEKTIIEACKAYESTIKSILDKRSIQFKKSDKIQELIKLLKDNGLFDPFLDNMYSNINAIMTSGINAIRNNKSGHGDGIDKQEVERSYASFAINLAGSCIVFLIDRYYEK